MKKFDRAGCAALGQFFLGLSAAICPFVSGAARAEFPRYVVFLLPENVTARWESQDKPFFIAALAKEFPGRAGQSRERAQRRLETAGASRGGAGERREGSGGDGDRSEGRRGDRQRRAEARRAGDRLRSPDQKCARRLLRFGGRAQDRSAAGLVAGGQHQGRRPDRGHRRLAGRRQRASVREGLHERPASRCSTRARARKSRKYGRPCGIPPRRKPKWSRSSPSRTMASTP